MEQKKLKQYWDILNSAEAYLRGGRRSDNPEPPGLLHKPGAATQKVSLEGARNRLYKPDEGTMEEQLPSSPVTEDVHVPIEDSLEKIAAEVQACRKCRLGENRRNAVPGEGVSNPKLMIIGEAPGGQEDSSGHPFVGPAGQYLDKWLKAINLSRREDVFIGNIIKCRPPDNRDPLPDETAACMPFLKRQLDLIQPRAILTLGRIATHILTDTTEGIGKLHGRVFHFRGVPLIPTYHPSGVLRNPVYRKPVWDDLQKVQRIIEKQE